MKVQELFKDYSYSPEFASTEITGLQNNHLELQPGNAFIAIKGTKHDGHDFLSAVVQKGAKALVIEDKSRVPAGFKGLVVQVPSARIALEKLAAEFYQHPSRKLFCTAVTGTNGKTSTTYLIEHFLNAAGIPTGVMGTVNHHLGSQVWHSEMTTPDPLNVQKRLGEFLSAGAKACAMEVSSHALDQHRVDHVEFKACIFTNLTRDHLDYHGTFENYFAAKEKLFNELPKRWNYPWAAIVNYEDPWIAKLQFSGQAKVLRFGEKTGELPFEILEQSFAGTKFSLSYQGVQQVFEIPLVGKHNIQNTVGALGAALFYGLSLHQLAEAAPSFTGVPGRLQRVPAKQVSVFIDYAHTPDALENVLKSLNNLRDASSKAKIWTIFGCGGDRDAGKRPQMAEIAEQWSDNVIVTSDNPRTEDPKKILQDIVKGLKKPALMVEVDRKKAIHEVLEKKVQPGDVVVIAGKGHEDYQIIGTQKKHFSDYEEAQSALKQRGWL